jgi:hypothetical protein
LAADLRASSTSHRSTWQNSRYTSRRAMCRSSWPGDAGGELAAQHPRPTFRHPQAPAGYVAEGMAVRAGLGEKTAIGVGATGAVATGAVVAVTAVLLVATAPVSLTVLAGAAVAGGLAAGFGYLTSRAMPR